jgi:serine/threonine protein kinase
MYVIKISKTDCIYDLMEEVDLIKLNFSENKINHPAYPIYCGFFKNLHGYGIIYPYFGFYNLEKIKTISYHIYFENNIKIILQIINQLKSLNNIIHCDLKPSNVVLNVVKNEVIVTIIDFGLIKNITDKKNVISTNYITSPESLLTLDNYNMCSILDEPLNLQKHDYIGLFSIVINLFITKTFWSVLFKYYADLNFNIELFYNHNVYYIFVYTWYKFCYNNINEIKNKSLANVIKKIELNYPNIVNKNFISYDIFFEKYIITNIDMKTIDKSKIDELKDFTFLLVQFDYNLRPNFDELLNHSFLIS